MYKSKSEKLLQSKTATGAAEYPDVSERVLAEMRAAGLPDDAAELLYLLPLLLVAWGQGGVAARERRLILEAAHLHGIREDHPAHRRLEEWLVKPPSRRTCEDALRLTRMLLNTLPPGERARKRDRIVQQCTRVALAAGSKRLIDLGHFISVEEHALLERIAVALTRGRDDDAGRNAA